MLSTILTALAYGIAVAIGAAPFVINRWRIAILLDSLLLMASVAVLTMLGGSPMTTANKWLYALGIIFTIIMGMTAFGGIFIAAEKEMKDKERGLIDT